MDEWMSRLYISCATQAHSRYAVHVLFTCTLWAYLCKDVKGEEQLGAKINARTEVK